MGFAVTWTNHYLDVLVVTSKRLIDIDQLSLFHRDIAEVRIENIEDIQIVVPGFLASWLGYGTLKIQTAGEDVEFMVRNLRDPETLKQTISAIEDRVRSKIPREV
jgi:CTP:phosphocholine cytidylyltransferase-like protein